MTAKTEPWFVGEQRLRKADKIAQHLQGMGVTADLAARFDADARRDAEAAIGARKSSDTTWRTIVEMLAGSATTHCPTCGLGDPEGDTGPLKPYGHTGRCAR